MISKPDQLSLPDTALLTWFGTLICLDVEQARLLHCPLERLRPGLVPLGLEGTALSLAHHPGLAAAPPLPGFQAAPGTHPGSLVFSHAARYLSALPDGELLPAAAAARDFEHFLPLGGGDVRRLRAILSGRWSLDGGPQVAAGLEGFNLKFGTRLLSLAAQLPFPAAAAGPLTLTTPEGEVQAVAVARDETRRIWINPLANIGNRALQYLTAASIARRVPGARVSNVHLDMWGREEPASRPAAWESATTGSRFHQDIDGLADCLRRGEVNAICLDGYTFHVDHYGSRAACRALLPAAADSATGYGPGELVCSVRGGEILRAAHPDYFPLPPAYYAMLQARTGLALVFYGQIGDDPYGRALRASFPQARFVPGVSPAHDFEVLRRSCHLALSISTFAWLAAWLSEAQSVHVPVGGMFSPVQHPDQLFLPVDEPAFHYMLLPPAKAVDLWEDPVRFWLTQDLIAQQARPASNEEIRGLVARAAGIGRGKVHVAGFDGAAYLAGNPDVAANARALRLTALEHYIAAGADEHRMRRVVEPLFYAATHPDAAQAVALGQFASLEAHYEAVGMGRGYQPRP